MVFTICVMPGRIVLLKRHRDQKQVCRVVRLTFTLHLRSKYQNIHIFVGFQVTFKIRVESLELDSALYLDFHKGTGRIAV